MSLRIGVDGLPRGSVTRNEVHDMCSKNDLHVTGNLLCKYEHC
jgi:hypothetical protein